MSSTDLVRSSRDGDQLHYYWAARQCLKLLLPGSGLAAVSIEGSSPEDPGAAGEQAADDDDPTGEYARTSAGINSLREAFFAQCFSRSSQRCAS